MRFKNYWLDFHYECYKFTYVILSNQSFWFFFSFGIHLSFFSLVTVTVCTYIGIHCCAWNANHRQRSMETSAFWSSFKLFYLLLLISPSSRNRLTMHKNNASNNCVCTEYNFIVDFPNFLFCFFWPLCHSHRLLLLDIFMCWLVFAHVVSNFLEYRNSIFAKSNSIVDMNLFLLLGHDVWQYSINTHVRHQSTYCTAHTHAHKKELPSNLGNA